MRFSVTAFAPLLVLLSSSALAQSAPPPSRVNSGSFARAHALPLLGEGVVLAAGQSAGRVMLNDANEYFDKGGDLLLDADTLRLDLGLRQGFAENWEWGISLPLLVQGGGSFDGFIEGWHSTFGLPNGGRELAPKDRYRIRYQRGGATLLDLSDDHSGLGDVQATLGWQAAPTLALRGLLQLPTGQASKLSGGHLGAAAWAEWTPLLEALPRLQSNLAAGVAVSQTRGPLSEVQKPFAAFTRAAIAVPIYRSLQGHLGLQLHSALYDDTGQKPISGPGGSTSFGFALAAWGCNFDLTAEEDILLNTSPDFALRLNMAYRSH